MTGFNQNKKYMKMLLFFLVASFVLALNLEESISEYIQLKFDGVSYDANIELAKLFFIVAVSNYVVEILLRYLKFGKLFGWI